MKEQTTCFLTYLLFPLELRPEDSSYSDWGYMNQSSYDLETVCVMSFTSPHILTVMSPAVL